MGEIVRPVLAYLVTEDWYFLSHRLPMAQAAQQAGYDVHVITNVRDGRAAIEGLGFRLHAMPWRRGRLNPFSVLAMARRVRRLYRELAPALVHHVALEPIVVGSLAALGRGIPQVNALTGLGFAFSGRTIKARLSRAILTLVLRFLLGRRRAHVLVQNPDDRDLVLALGLSPDRVTLIPGSGVDTDRLQPLPEPAAPITAAFVGRLLDDKGIRTAIAAQRLLHERGRPIRLLVAGRPDPANPSSVTAAEMESWRRQPGVSVLGHVTDIETVWAAAHIALLPSRREGVPKSLLEAAACGRALVATDVPGCREIARQDVNALLVPPDDPEALAAALDRLACDAELRRRFGRQARILAEQEFSSRQVSTDIARLYDRLAGRGKAAAG
jgi:glycosyltransferase involved in cell wall biosynthesis